MRRQAGKAALTSTAGKIHPPAAFKVYSITLASEPCMQQFPDQIVEDFKISSFNSDSTCIDITASALPLYRETLQRLLCVAGQDEALIPSQSILPTHVAGQTLIVATGSEAAEVHYRCRTYGHGAHLPCRNPPLSSRLTSFIQIGQVKEKVAAEKGWEATSQKLIYAG